MPLDRNRGLSIGELVVATGLLALMLVTVIVLFAQMLEATTKSTMLAQGAFFAESVMERAITPLKADNDPSIAEGSWSTVKNVQSQTTFLYRVECTELPSTPPDPLGKAYSLTVEVRWWQESMDDPQKNRRGLGKLSVKRTRLVYVHNVLP